MSNLHDLAAVLNGLALMQPNLPPLDHVPIFREFHRRADLGGAPQRCGAGEHVPEVRLTDYFSDLNGKLALGGGQRNAGLR